MVLTGECGDSGTAEVRFWPSEWGYCAVSGESQKRAAYGALGEMRGTFGVHLTKIAAEFKLDIEDRLAEILPAPATDSDDDDRHPARRPRPR